MKRSQNKVRRVLLLIDAMAPLRLPFTVKDAMRHLKDRTNGDINVCEKTIERDIYLLVSMNFAYVVREGGGGKPFQYKMNLRLTANAERAAIKVAEEQ